MKKGAEDIDYHWHAVKMHFQEGCKNASIHKKHTHAYLHHMHAQTPTIRRQTRGKRIRLTQQQS